ncbi:MAG: GntR family transcriptional regulator [Anaerorhabdus sp.]|uniref:GntR family transcriptional regulator n=1 Tax=Anaerorhabdus sp. TaxID=1872524 RepID=UPI003A84C55A
MINKKPRYIVIMESVQEYIAKNNLKAGDKLPTEQELINEFGVSRATVRQAMQELEIEGIIKKIHGIGTFVEEERMNIQMQGFFSFSEESKQSNERYETKILEFKKTRDVPSKVFKKLEIADNSEVILIERLRFINMEPVLLEITYIPAYYYKPPLPKKFNYDSLYDFIREFGVKKLEGKEKLLPYLATNDEANKLLVDKKTPLLRFTRVLKEENPVEYSISILKPGKVRIQTIIERTL